MTPMIWPMRRYKVSTQPALCVCAERSSRHFLHRRRSGRRDCRHFLFSDWETRITHEILANRKVSVPFVGTCRVHNAGPSIHILHYNSRGSARVALWAPLSVISLYRTIKSPRTKIFFLLLAVYSGRCNLSLRPSRLSRAGTIYHFVFTKTSSSLESKEKIVSPASRTSQTILLVLTGQDETLIKQRS